MHDLKSFSMTSLGSTLRAGGDEKRFGGAQEKNKSNEIIIEIRNVHTRFAYEMRCVLRCGGGRDGGRTWTNCGGARPSVSFAPSWRPDGAPTPPSARPPGATRWVRLTCSGFFANPPTSFDERLRRVRMIKGCAFWWCEEDCVTLSLSRGCVSRDA